VPARFSVTFLRVGDIEQDLFDLAALVGAQLLEIERPKLLICAGVVLGVHELDRFVQYLARSDVDVRRRRLVSLTGPLCEPRRSKHEAGRKREPAHDQTQRSVSLLFHGSLQLLG
jgi:hypothetical protein